MLPLTFHPRTHRNRNLRLFHRLPTAGDGQDPPGGHLSTAVPVPPLARPVGKAAGCTGVPHSGLRRPGRTRQPWPRARRRQHRRRGSRPCRATGTGRATAAPASGAYRDPHAAKARLDEMVKRQGWTRPQRGSPRTVPSSAICEAKLDFLPVPVQRPNAPAPSGRPNSVAPSLECIGAAEARAAQTFRGSPNQLGNAAGRRPRGPGRSHDHQAGATA